MNTNAYIGINNKSRKIKKIYKGVNDKSRMIKKAYIGKDDKSRLFFYNLASDFTVSFIEQDLTPTYHTVNEYYCGMENGIWRLYGDTTSSQSSDKSRLMLLILISGMDMSGMTLSMVYKRTPAWRKNKDDIYLLYVSSSNTAIGSEIYLDGSEYTTYTKTIPDGCYSIHLVLSQGTNGRNITTEFLIKSFSIDGISIL